METLQNIAIQFELATTLLKSNMPFVLILIGALYGIHVVNFLLGYRLNILGIYPRRIWGLIGIATSPFLHGHFNHIFFNSIPLFILMSMVLLYGQDTFYCVSAIVIFIGGLGTWLFGRRGLHVGASGLIMGYWSYLLLYAYEQSSMLSVALAGVCLYYFGGFIFNLFPLEVKSSWEAHIFGFLGGITAAFACPYLNLLWNFNFFS
jgi:membrane associated rhomboid family serine protease